MAVVVGFDIHCAQITYDLLDTDTGEIRRGRITHDLLAGARGLSRAGALNDASCYALAEASR